MTNNQDHEVTAEVEQLLARLVNQYIEWERGSVNDEPDFMGTVKKLSALLQQAELHASERLMAEYKDLLRRNWQVVEDANSIPKSFITVCLSAEKERYKQLQKQLNDSGKK